jgi:hypothetical protein
VLYVGSLVASRRLDPGKMVIGLVAVLSLSTLFIVSPEARDTVGRVASSVLLDKQQSDSYKARTESHASALLTLRDTYYTGAGLGSMRASGMGYMVLASMGIPGFLLLIAAYFALFLKPQRGAWCNHLRERSLFAVSMLLCGLFIAGAQPLGANLWFLFGTSIVAGTRKTSERRTGVASRASTTPASTLLRPASL